MGKNSAWLCLSDRNLKQGRSVKKAIKTTRISIFDIVGIFIDFFSLIATRLGVGCSGCGRRRIIEFRRTHAKRERFLAHCKQMEKFIGQNFDFALSKLGPATFFASMDFGYEIAQWRRHGLVVELWFREGSCISAAS